MSNPSFENIDRWLFELTEGNLSENQINQLENFIFLHPELNIDLDAWKSSKVSRQSVDYSTAHLVKALPAGLYAWTTTAFVSLVFSIFIGFNSDFFEVNPKYAISSIDVSLIESYDSLQGDRTLLTNHSKNNNADINIVENIVEEKNNLISTSSTNTKASSNNKTISEKRIDDYTFKNPITPSEKTNAPSFSENELLTVNTDESTFKSIEATDHQDVISHLEEGNEIEEIQYRRRFQVSGNSQSGVKKKLKSFALKLKKMADQPVALSNSKSPHFHAPNMTGYQANFGMVGTLLRNRFQATSRNQWVGYENQQMINTLSWDSYIHELRGGLGIDVSYSDYQNGSLQNFNAGITYSPKFSINKNIAIEPALRYKMGTIDLNNESPVVGSHIEMSRQNVRGLYTDGDSPIGSRLWYKDVGAGLLLNTKWFYAGVNLDNIRRHYNNIYTSEISNAHRADLAITSVIGSEFKPRGRSITMSAYLLHQKFNELNELWAGGNIQWKWLQFGAGVNNNFDFGSSLGVDFEKVSLHYNLDYLSSQLIDQKILSHQLTMRVLLRPNRFARKFLNI